MKLKEVVNLRKLEEFYNDTNPDNMCLECPFESICDKWACMIEKMFGYEDKDMWDYEREGIPVKDIKVEFSDLEEY